MANGTNLDGKYAYRFSGFSVFVGTPYYLTGIGTLNLTEGGRIDGVQRAATTPLAGLSEAHSVRKDTITGTYAMSGDEGTAKVTFTGARDLEGGFDLVRVDSDRFWLISTAAKLLPGGAAADEVITGEAVRIGSGG